MGLNVGQAVSRARLVGRGEASASEDKGDLASGKGKKCGRAGLVVVPQSVIEAQTIPIEAHTKEPTADEIVDVSDALQ